ncbi:MAG: Panacea domain-containing protein [Acidimicrobiia bacterium]
MHEYNENKLGELILWFAAHLRSEPAGGSTKLNKLLFYADFVHMRTYGHPITGAEYQRLPHGPAPRRLIPVREALISSGSAELVTENYLGLNQRRLVPLRPPDMAHFSAEEKATIELVFQELGARTGTDLSDRSHLEPVWDLVEQGETIPYEGAFLRVGPPGERVLRHAAELARRVSAGGDSGDQA